MAKTATWAQVQAKANELGATVEHDEEIGDLYAYSPIYKTFNATRGSIMCEPYTNNAGQSWKPQAYAQMLERLECGVSDAEPDYEGWWTDSDEGEE